MSTWENTALCLSSDVEKELPNLEDIFQIRQGSTILADIDSHIETAKDVIRQELMLEISNIFGSRNSAGITYGDFSSGKTILELRTVLDFIDNPEELKRSAVAQTILVILAARAIQFSMAMEDSSKVVKELRDYWEKQYQQRFNLAKNLLWFDLDESGEITDGENLRNKQGIFKV